MVSTARRRHGMLGKGSGSASSTDRLLRKGRDGVDVSPQPPGSI